MIMTTYQENLILLFLLGIILCIVGAGGAYLCAWLERRFPPEN